MSLIVQMDFDKKNIHLADSKWNVNPDIIEDQVTYPIISQLLGVPKVKISGDDI